MRVIVSPDIERVLEVKFSPAVFVVANEQDRLTNHCHDRVLVLLRQAVQEPWGILVSTTVRRGMVYCLERSSQSPEG